MSKLRYIICMLMVFLMVSGCSHNNEFADFLEQNGYDYYIEQKNRLDRTIHVHIRKDDIFFDFHYYNAERYTSFKFCDQHLKQCYEQLFTEKGMSYFIDGYTTMDDCIFLYEGSKESFDRLSGNKCESFDHDKILKRMDEELKNISRDLDTLLKDMVSLAS